MSFIGFYTITRREVLRFTKIWTQTILPAVISAVLFIAIFGIALGDRFGDLLEIPYIQFIIPGLIMMSLITNSFGNTSSSIYLSRFVNHIEEILVSPLSYLEMVSAYTIGGILRGIAVSLGVYLISLFFIQFAIHNVFIVLYFVILVSAIFSSLGIIVGLWSETFDQMSILPTFVITPLIFFGGVFHSTQVVPEFLKIVTLFNPIFYMVDGLRYGFLGIIDGNLIFSMSLVLVLAISLFLFTVYLFKIGYKLRT